MRINAAVLTFCLLASAQFVSSASELRDWPAASRKGPIRVEFKDGTSIEGLGPVTGDERTVRFRLASGQLVSIKLETVERITVADGSVVPDRVERDREDAKRPMTSAASRAVSYSNEDLAGVFGNTDLPPVPESPRSPPANPPAPGAGAVSPPGDGPGAPTPPGIGPLDRNGRDEQWWRARVTEPEEELETTQADIERLEKEFRVAKAIVSAPMPSAPSSHSASRPSKPGPLPLRRNARVSSQDAGKIATFEDLKRDLDAAKAREKELQAEIDGLPNEARRAGALPGWIR